MRSTTADAAAQATAILAAELSDVVGSERPPQALRPSSASADWAASGAMALTGRAGAAPCLAPGAPASWVRAAAGFLDVAPADPGALLGERAACAQLTRRAPWSVGGTFRSMPAKDGWFGLSLARASDLDLVPAFVAAGTVGDAWETVTRWVADRSLVEVEERAALLGLPGAAIPTAVPALRPAIQARGGGSRPRASGWRPVVIDLSALWAGPLCAQLLGLGGARVIKVESWDRPDGARRGPQAFYDLLHGGHESVALHLDRADGRHALSGLVRHADVVIEASRPRALRQLGLNAEECVAKGTVWVAISAYGRGEEERVGFGDDVAAAGGLVRDDGDGPYPVGDAIADPLAGVTAAAAASVALRSGRGWLLDVSMRDVAAAVARLTADEAEVVRHGEDWFVAGTSSTAEPVRVRQPRARRAPARAARVGAHTDAVLAEFDLRAEPSR